jgi:outer membrane protein
MIKRAGHGVLLPGPEIDLTMPKTFHLSCILALTALTCVAATPAAAQTAASWQAPRAGDFLVTARATVVAPTTEDRVLTRAGADAGLRVDVSDDYMPTLGFTYFFTDNLAVEAILGATQHEIRAIGGATNVAVHDTWVLPPVVTVQYRPLTQGRISPYVGAGLNGMIFFEGKNRNGFNVDLENGLGYALQAGADVGLTGPWSANLDVKKVFFNTDAQINGGALRSDVDLNPWVVSIGLSRRF